MIQPQRHELDRYLSGPTWVDPQNTLSFTEKHGIRYGVRVISWKERSRAVSEPDSPFERRPKRFYAIIQNG